MDIRKLTPKAFATPGEYVKRSNGLTVAPKAGFEQISSERATAWN